MSELLEEILDILNIGRYDPLPWQILTIDNMIEKYLKNAYDKGYEYGYEVGQDSEFYNKV